MKITKLPVGGYRIARPVRFGIEVAAGLAIAVFGAWLAAWTGARLNDKVNRQAQAGERIAAALERAYPVPVVLPKPSLLGQEPVCEDVKGLSKGRRQKRCTGIFAELGDLTMLDDAPIKKRDGWPSYCPQIVRIGLDGEVRPPEGLPWAKSDRKLAQKWGHKWWHESPESDGPGPTLPTLGGTATDTCEAAAEVKKCRNDAQESALNRIVGQGL